jgi:hypothetical protein
MKNLFYKFLYLLHTVFKTGKKGIKISKRKE